jgi:hypothetical protein
VKTSVEAKSFVAGEYKIVTAPHSAQAGMPIEIVAISCRKACPDLRVRWASEPKAQSSL